MQRRHVLKGAGLAFLAIVASRSCAGEASRHEFPTRNVPWERFTDSLRGKLQTAMDGDFFQLQDAPGYGVSVTATARGLIAEATSILYVADHDDVSESLQRRLLELGWQSPSLFKSGQPNWYVEIRTPVRA